MAATFYTTSTLKKSLFYVVCLFFVSVVAISNSTHAYELGRDVFEVSSGQFTMSGSTNCLNNINNNTVIRNGCTDTPDGLTTLGVILPGGISDQYLTGDFMQFWFYIGINNTNDASDSFIRNINISNQYLDTVDVSMEQVNNSIGIVKITARATQTTGVSSFNITASGGSVFLVLYPSEFISAGKIVHWRIVPGVDYSSDIQSVISAINNQTDYSQSLNNINNNINSVNNNLRNIQDTAEQANDDANDRYQDEKDTINDNGDTATGSWDDAQENLQFSAPTGLFSWLWSLGSVDDCVQIPVLASLLHSTESQYCSWYPTSIRSIISPIINIFIICLMSGFVFSWLKKGGV